ncbi:IS1595 family transposase, partial [Oceanidesulfovibrio marinus]
MAAGNKYVYRSRISEKKFRELVRLFALDIDAQRVTAMTKLNRNTVNRYLRLLRMAMARACEEESPFLGQVEMDESYFGPRRVRGVVGRGAGRKTIVFGILERGGRVYTQVVPNCSRKVIHAIIQGKVDQESEVFSDQYGSYDGLVDLGYQRHYRIRHGKGEFARGTNHINGIESFWSFAKRRLQKFHGVPKATFYLHLKECEFRFNHRYVDLYKILLKLCREN